MRFWGAGNTLETRLCSSADGARGTRPVRRAGDSTMDASMRTLSLEGRIRATHFHSHTRTAVTGSAPCTTLIVVDLPCALRAKNSPDVRACVLRVSGPCVGQHHTQMCPPPSGLMHTAAAHMRIWLLSLLHCLSRATFLSRAQIDGMCRDAQQNVTPAHRHSLACGWALLPTLPVHSDARYL